MSKPAKPKPSKKAPRRKALRITKPGMYADVPMRSYVNDPCPAPSMSTGSIETLYSRSPAHVEAEHPRLGAKPDTHGKRSDIGSAVHQLVLGGDQRIVWIDAKNYYGKEAKKAREEAYANWQIPILIEDMERVERAAEEAAKLIAEEYGEVLTEQTLIWKENGVWCRARPDMVVGARFLGDLKTTENANPKTWIDRTFANSYFDAQAAHQLAGWQAIKNEKRDFLFIVQEIDEPFANCIVGLGPQDEEIGGRKRERALRLFAKSLKSKSWPAYGRDVHWTEPPPWKLKQVEERLMHDPEAA